MNLGTDYHVRGVVKEISEEINAVRRELKKMEIAGLLKSRKEGNKVVYFLRKSYPLYEDFLSLVHKEFGIGGNFLKYTKEIGKIKYAMVTRSFTKGIPIEPHDVDLIIVGDVNMQVLANAIKESEKEIGREVRYTVMTEEEFEYRKKKRDIFLLNILAGSKIMLVGDEDEILSAE